MPKHVIWDFLLSVYQRADVFFFSHDRVVIFPGEMVCISILQPFILLWHHFFFLELMSLGAIVSVV